MNPETPSDIRLILAALSQEISTLMMHIDPRRSAVHPADRSELRQRLHKLMDHHRLFEQQLRQMIAGTRTRRFTPTG